jgi:hypothetical protein
MALCISHARMVKSGAGPCVLAHTPCARGRFDSPESRVQLLPVTSLDHLLARIEAMGLRLDKAQDVNKRLARQMALLTRGLVK